MRQFEFGQITRLNLGGAGPNVAEDRSLCLLAMYLFLLLVFEDSEAILLSSRGSKGS
jgi:hypothetical protein